jgi:cytochrome P450
MGYARTLGRFYKGALLLRDHGEHRFQRRIMQSAFKTEAMRGYFGTMGPMLKEAVEGWDGREDFLFFPAIKQALLDVAATIFVGLDKGDVNRPQFSRHSPAVFGEALRSQLVTFFH